MLHCIMLYWVNGLPKPALRVADHEGLHAEIRDHLGS